MRNRKDLVWNQYHNNSVGLRTGNRKAAKAVQPESGDITHDILWGLKPEDYYTGKVIIRRKPAQS